MRSGAKTQTGGEPSLAIDGTFSVTSTAVIGTGATQQKVFQVQYYHAVQTPGGDVEVQALNGNYAPAGEKKRIDLEEFLSRYMPEPELHLTEVLPRMRSVRQAVARGDRHRSRKEHFSAEMEYGKALAIDEENIRANFGIGLCFLARSEKDKSVEVFRRLVKLKAAFEPEHKHLFNEFGIDLRKNGLHRQALSFYTKAASLEPQDENLCYNIARCLLDMGKPKEARRLLERALKLNPDFAEAKGFMRFLEGKQASGG